MDLNTKISMFFICTLARFIDFALLGIRNEVF
jgi:hypothetical protein